MPGSIKTACVIRRICVCVTLPALSKPHRLDMLVGKGNIPVTSLDIALTLMIHFSNVKPMHGMVKLLKKMQKKHAQSTEALDLCSFLSYLTCISCKI